MRLVLDANVIIAAFIARGVCEALFDICVRDHELMTSEHLLEEITSHLSGKFGFPMVRVTEIEAHLRKHATIVTPMSMGHFAFSDSDDLPVLGTAVAANAAVLVTGDRALLELGVIQSIPILNPRVVYDRLQRRGDASPPAGA